MSAERGQTLAINVLFLAALLGFLALVIDGGNALLQRRNLQGIADAAALAGVQDITVSQTSAAGTARSYALTHNDASEAEVDAVVTTTGSSGSCGGRTVPPWGVCVQLQRDLPGFFAQLAGSGPADASARAIAGAYQVHEMGKWLPIGLMDGAWTSGTQISFVPGSATSPSGTINPDAGASCSFSGANTIRMVAMSAAFGGEDACPLPIGSFIPTQTGGTNGPVLQGLTARVGSNTDSFEDVFEWSPSAGRYVIRLPDSPRVGIVPLARGGNRWSLQGGAQMEVVGFGVVYLGNRSRAGYPPVTGGGSNQQIHMTPVDAVMPASWEVEVGSYDPANHGPVVYRLVG